MRLWAGFLYQMHNTLEPDMALTAKQDAFALAYFETGNAAEAYRRAYDVSENAKDQWIYVEASQLLDHPDIAIRIEELEAMAQKLSMFTRQKAFEEYEEARKMANKVLNPSAAVSAISGKVKLFGLDAPVKSKHEYTGKDGGPIQTEEVGGLSKLSDRELAQLERLTDKTRDSEGVGEAD